MYSKSISMNALTLLQVKVLHDHRPTAVHKPQCAGRTGETHQYRRSQARDCLPWFPFMIVGCYRYCNSDYTMGLQVAVREEIVGAATVSEVFGICGVPDQYASGDRLSLAAPTPLVSEVVQNTLIPEASRHEAGSSRRALDRGQTAHPLVCLSTSCQNGAHCQTTSPYTQIRHHDHHNIQNPLELLPSQC
jgi:hypothetical protein